MWLKFYFSNSEEGYLYDKEAILKYILTRKKEIARKMKEYEKQKNKSDVSVCCVMLFCT